MPGSPSPAREIPFSTRTLIDQRFTMHERRAREMRDLIAERPLPRLEIAAQCGGTPR